MREVICNEGCWVLTAKEQRGEFYIQHFPVGDDSGLVGAGIWVSPTELDALCEWWTKKKQAKEVSTEIERLREQNRELREALRPFAVFEYSDRWPDDELLFHYNGAEVTIGDVRRAKAILEKG